MLITARRALFTILILLTAFRGVVGDAMAYEMAQGMLQPINASSTAGMPCHEAQATAEMPVDEPPQALACSTCQVCHLSVTLPFSASAHTPTVPRASKPHLSVSAWVSADLRLLSKPPLS